MSFTLIPELYKKQSNGTDEINKMQLFLQKQQSPGKPFMGLKYTGLTVHVTSTNYRTS